MLFIISFFCCGLNWIWLLGENGGQLLELCASQSGAACRLLGVPEGGPQSPSKINTSFTFIETSGDSQEIQERNVCPLCSFTLHLQLMYGLCSSIQWKSKIGVGIGMNPALGICEGIFRSIITHYSPPPKKKKPKSHNLLDNKERHRQCEPDPSFLLGDFCLSTQSAGEQPSLE